MIILLLHRRMNGLCSALGEQIPIALYGLRFTRKYHRSILCVCLFACLLDDQRGIQDCCCSIHQSCGSVWMGDLFWSRIVNDLRGLIHPKQNSACIKRYNHTSRELLNFIELIFLDVSIEPSKDDNNIQEKPQNIILLTSFILRISVTNRYC